MMVTGLSVKAPAAAAATATKNLLTGRQMWRQLMAAAVSVGVAAALQ